MVDKLYRDAIRKAAHGYVAEALELAELIQIKKHGNMNNIQFRCVTTTRIVTFTAGEITNDRIA